MYKTIESFMIVFIILFLLLNNSHRNSLINIKITPLRDFYKNGEYARLTRKGRRAMNEQIMAFFE